MGEIDTSDAGPTTREAVILLHGLGRTKLSMWLLARRLAEAGYDCHSFQYVAAVDGSVFEISRRLIDFIAERVAPERRFHLVGHSLGGIIIRAGFQYGYPPALGRVVMMGTPNQGAHLARRNAGRIWFRLFSGRAGQELGDDRFFDELPRPSVPTGIIAGTVGQSLTFDEPNDGIVAVESTRLAGMADFVTVPRIHTFLMNGRDTAQLVHRFLERGRFAPS